MTDPSQTSSACDSGGGRLFQESVPATDYVPFPVEALRRSVPDLFEQAVAKHAERLAVRGRARELTYDALNRRANRVAHAILSARGNREEPVALLLEHDVATIVGILGVLKAGKSYVPLDASYPRERIDYILADTQVELLLSSDKTLSMARARRQNEATILNIDRLDRGLSEGNPGLSIPCHAIAAVMYTSGSTGRPKGVMYAHRNLLHSARVATNGYHVCQEDRNALLASCSFGASISDVYTPLLNGGRVCPFNVRNEGVSGLPEWLVREGITILHVVPTLFRNFVNALRGDERFPKLRLVALGGETIQMSDMDLYRRYMPDHCLLRVSFALSEAAATVSRVLIDKATDIPGNVVPAGYAVEDTEVLVVDDEGRPVGSDTVGEIVIQGPYLSPGYWRRPDLTAQAFRPVPGRDGLRSYRTGDLGRLSPDGCLTYVGRKDFQLKIRGFRVEPGEIETALGAHGSVKDVVVVAREDAPGDKRLVAYVAANGAPQPTAGELKESLKAKLPDYMVPSAIVVLEKLPLTPNDKVDRLALPAPDRAAFAGDAPFVPARTLVERQLAKIWTEILRVGDVGVTDNFFDLGGHSLLAVRLFTQIENIFGRKLPLATLMNAPTIEKLASVLREQPIGGASSALMPIETGGTLPPFFCVASRDALAFLYLARHLGADQPFYALHPLNLIDLEAPRFEVGDLVRRYAEALRAVQRTGPYFIGGICYGGIIACELANELQRQGQEVALLALLDTPYPWTVLPRPFAKVMRSAARSWHTFQRLDRGSRWSYVCSRSRALFRRTTGRVDVSAEPDTAGAVDAVYWRVIPQAYQRAFAHYRPKPYSFPVALFLASDTPVGFLSDWRMKWRKLATGKHETHVVPGDHDAILREPHVRTLTAKLRESLRAAQQNTPRAAP